jgi:hypothetical protein
VNCITVALATGVFESLLSNIFPPAGAFSGNISAMHQAQPWTIGGLSDASSYAHR